MKLLILGGTRFLGRHLAQQALQAGHQVTLLHRGLSGPQLFAQADHRLADRNDEAALRAALAGGEWHCAIDTSAYVPRHVRSAAAALGARVGQYQLVSSISVYAQFNNGGNAEDAALATLADPNTETIDGSTYGGLKAQCEVQALQAFGDRALVVRPGLIVGPHDPTGRYTWWVQRLLRGGEVLAPGEPQMPVQCIDVRDLAGWMLQQAAAGTRGAYNLTGPALPTTFAALLAEMTAALSAKVDSEVRFNWVDEDFLLHRGVAPWSDLPLWLPRDSVGLHRTRIGRALATGLRCRPVGQTATDTAQWLAEGPGLAPGPAGPARPTVGLSAEREQALLREWGQRGG